MALNSSTLNINQTHHVVGTKNRFVYRFPTTQNFTRNDTVSLQEISIYNSMFNITSSKSNNTFSIIWHANTSIQYDFVIPDSFLDIDGINAYIKQQLILNKLYMIETSTGKYVQFITLQVNKSRYAAEFFISPLPTSAEATSNGWTVPSASWSLPVSAKTPQIIISTGFGELLGMNSATLPPSVQATDYEKLSDKTPQIVTTTNILIGCNLITNQYSNPSTLMTALPINGDFGSLLFFSNNSGHNINVAGGQFSEVEIVFYDQLNRPLEMNDININILLNIKRTI